MGDIFPVQVGAYVSSMLDATDQILLADQQKPYLYLSIIQIQFDP